MDCESLPCLKSQGDKHDPTSYPTSSIHFFGITGWRSGFVLCKSFCSCLGCKNARRAAGRMTSTWMFGNTENSWQWLGPQGEQPFFDRFNIFQNRLAKYSLVYFIYIIHHTAIYIIYLYSKSYGSVSKPCTPSVHIKIAGKWMFIPLKMVLIGIDS